LLGSPNRRQSLRQAVGDGVVGAFRDQDLRLITHVAVLISRRPIGLTVALDGVQQSLDPRTFSIQ